jgi:bifunctional UDP-N-acetylglucosamine pyrophosphorylase/glucosamine-1-phosphate N-acetyltransferase
MTAIACIVLAAGMGTRMKSNLPKVLHKAGGRSLLGHALSTVAELAPQGVNVVVGPDMDIVSAEAKASAPDCRVFEQTKRNGTAHAVSVAMPGLDGFSGQVLILYGDVPLIESETLRELCIAAGDTMAVLGFNAADPHGYGRLISDGDRLLAIREHLDASEQERGISICNSGIICIDNTLLQAWLPQIGNDNAKGEYYLTDLVEICNARSRTCRYTLCDEDQVRGVNDRAQLAEIEAILQTRYRTRAMRNGATLVAPQTVFLSPDTKIGRDVVIEPNVVIGPGVEIADGAHILSFCHLEGAKIAGGCSIGPYARLRPGADVQTGAKVGNFVEIKKASIEPGAKVNHLTYIGDARVGEGANIGAGTITCNYDGFFKHFTDIGAGAFIGSNSSLVAPVKIGDGALVGSGSVITRDVEHDALVLARGRQEQRTGWAKKFREAMLAKKSKS